MHRKFQMENLNRREHLGDLGFHGMIILKMNLNEIGCGLDSTGLAYCACGIL
jgi:hypothetical protein